MTAAALFQVILFAPVIGAALTAVLSSSLSLKLAKAISTIPFVALVLLMLELNDSPSGTWVLLNWSWLPGIPGGIGLALSPLSSLFLLLSLLSITTAIWQMSSPRLWISAPALLLLQSTITILFSSQSLIAFAAASQTFYLTLCLLARCDSSESPSAFRQMIAFTLVSGALLLGAAVVLAGISPTADNGPGHILFWTLVLAIWIQAPLVPAHGWLKGLDSLAAKTAFIGSSGSIAVYAWVQWILPALPEPVGETSVLLSILLAFSFAYSSILACFTSDLRDWLSHLTVSQTSLALLGISLFSLEGTSAGVLHALYWPIPFLAVAYLSQRLRQALTTTNTHDIGSLRIEAPRTALVLGIFFLAIAGLPGTAMFASVTAVTSSLVFQHPIVLALALVGVVAGLVSTARIAQPLLVRQASPHSGVRAVPNLRWASVLIFFLVALSILIMGLKPNELRRHTEPLLDQFWKAKQRA